MENLKDTFFEVLYSIIPITVILIILQFTVIFLPTEVFLQFLIGVILASIGIFLFLLGVQVGLSPVGEMIGSSLSKTKKISLILMFGFLLGFVVTMAEPGVRVLSNQVDFVSDGDISSSMLMIAVAVGVGVFVALALARIIFDISLLKLLIIGYLIIFVLALFTPSTFVPISLDAGGATTGPMAVPFILALGVGVTSVLRGKATSGDGFGLIALASIGPVISVLILGVIYG
ncbi:hypothetical protein J2T56_002030 [Natronobacillus azotifigens]|uniref:DUF1538 domain-containing protein n=1 Tax=Natronobacillus azotifigens TaxID=472978 RepID=A0A9J6RF11_9BACI|nr:DUF1538 domain-containing protein [Natronobacillus azotifigens]MCZ0703761.1 DUF1538 domain-containing protein [Natronobacillus azotifigens]